MKSLSNSPSHTAKCILVRKVGKLPELKDRYFHSTDYSCSIWIPLNVTNRVLTKRLSSLAFYDFVTISYWRPVLHIVINRYGDLWAKARSFGQKKYFQKVVKLSHIYQPMVIIQENQKYLCMDSCTSFFNAFISSSKVDFRDSNWWKKLS